jgi:hypothetical protein
MKFPCRAFRSATAQLQQFIADPQQLFEGIVVDHHAGSLRYFCRAAKQAFR